MSAFLPRSPPYSIGYSDVTNSQWLFYCFQTYFLVDFWFLILELFSQRLNFPSEHSISLLASYIDFQCVLLPLAVQIMPGRRLDFGLRHPPQAEG